LHSVPAFRGFFSAKKDGLGYPERANEKKNVVDMETSSFRNNSVSYRFSRISTRRGGRGV